MCLSWKGSVAFCVIQHFIGEGGKCPSQVTDGELHGLSGNLSTGRLHVLKLGCRTKFSRTNGLLTMKNYLMCLFT